jgi:hypothetical protein
MCFPDRLALWTATAIAALVFTLAPARPAHADRYELTIGVRPTRGTARIGDAGTTERAHVQSRGLAAGASWGVRDWLDLGGELVATDFDEATYQMATLPVSVDPLSGPLKRSSRLAQLRGVATLRLGVTWVPFVQLALGAGARHRFTALLYSPTAQGERWLVPDGQGQEVTIDVVAAVRAGLERRLTPHWTAGISAAVSHATGIFTPDLQTADITLSLSYAWYPRLTP